MGVPVILSTASTWPEPLDRSFQIAAELGYDGVEVMVWGDPASQDVATLARLADRHDVPVLALHAPCLLISQRIWSRDPVTRLRRAVAAASTLGAPTVVLHPPFRWQRGYATGFTDQVRVAEECSGVAVAVENMFPVRRGRIAFSGFHPSHDPTDVGHRHYTLDLSHTSAARQDALALLARMDDRLTHVHLGDGSGLPRDEHLVPGRGSQPCAQVCEALGARGYSGSVAVEVSTRRARTHDERLTALAESLLFARLHLEATAAPERDRSG